MRRRVLLLPFVVLALVALGTEPAGACGGLVAPNGTVRLVRTTTLAGWHAGVEHYITSFQFAGDGDGVSQFGSIVPLPAVPTSVVRGGDWTLQRLRKEIVTPFFGAAAAAAAGGTSAGSTAQVLLTTKVDSLDITVLKGGARAVGQWAKDDGFLLTPDAPAVLDYYAKQSPIFMAVRFDAARARQQGEQVGDGIPVHVTMPLAEPWVPLRILTLGRQPFEPVDADVFLLTDDAPVMRLPTGTTIQRSEPASDQLLTDLRSDKGMSWMPSSMWLTYVDVSTSAEQLTKDLKVRVPLPPPPPTTTVTPTTAAPPITSAPTTAPPSAPAQVALPVTHAGYDDRLPIALAAGCFALLALLSTVGWRRASRPRKG